MSSLLQKPLRPANPFRLNNIFNYQTAGIKLCTQYDSVEFHRLFYHSAFPISLRLVDLRNCGSNLARVDRVTANFDKCGE